MAYTALAGGSVWPNCLLSRNQKPQSVLDFAIDQGMSDATHFVLSGGSAGGIVITKTNYEFSTKSCLHTYTS